MILSFIDYLFILLFFNSCLVISSKHKHLLSTLLSLEFLVIVMFLLIFNFLNFNLSEMYFLMVFLVFMVCEGSLGLSILVLMIRVHGNNLFQSFNSLMC